MATTSTYTKACGQGDHYTLKITVTVNSQNIANNTSNVTVAMTAQSDSTSYQAYNLSAVNPVKLIVNGTAVFNKNIAIDLRNMRTANLASWTGNITHSADGTKTLACTGSFYVSDSSSLGSSYADDATLSTSTPLSTIPRASSITSASNVTLGNSGSIIWTPASTAFYYKVKLSLGTWSSTSAAIHPNTTSAYTYTTAVIPTSAASQLPNAASGTMTATLYTYSSSACTTQIGSASSKTFTVTVPSSIVPSISSITVTDTAIVSGTSTFLSTYGGYVQSYSKPSITISAAGNSGSTIKTYTVALDGKSYSAASSPIACSVLSSSGTLTANVTVTDSRGRKATKSTQITVLPYTAPTITNFSVYRCNTDGTKNDNGAYLNAVCTCTVSPLLNGTAVQNSAALTCVCTPTSGGTPLTNSVNITGSDSAQTESIIMTSTNTETSYIVYLQLTDSLTSVKTSNYSVGTTYVLLHLSDNGDGFAIGKACELNDMFDINLETIFRKAVTINTSKIVEKSSGLLSISGSLTTGGKEAWNDAAPGAYIGSDGSLHLSHASAGGYIGFHWAKNTTSNITLKQTSSDTLDVVGGKFKAVTMMCGNKTGYLDGKTGIYLKDEGYMHLQRSNGNPYLGFIYGTGTAITGAIGMKDANTIYISDATYFMPYTTNKTSLGSVTYVWERCAAKYYFAGTNTYSASNASMYCYWKDGATHDMLVRNANGLDLYLGWVGSSSYATNVILQAQSYKLGSASGTTISSDRNLKKDFCDYDKKWETFYRNLKPLTYRYKLGTSGRRHCGFVTQDVESALKTAGLTTQQFGGVNIAKIEHRETEPVRDTEGKEIGSHDIELSNVNCLLDQGINEEHNLIYSEFISLNTWMIQKLINRIEALEAKLDIT